MNVIRFSLVAMAIYGFGSIPELRAEERKLSLQGWGVDEKNVEAFVPEAVESGFETLITTSMDPEFLTRAVGVCAKHKAGLYSCISPTQGLGRLWERTHSGRPVPWQKMNEFEDAAFKFIGADNNKYLIPFQFGGEPVLAHEVLGVPIICFNQEEAKNLLKQQMDKIVAVPGLTGIAFDGFGYQNYRRCYCEVCDKKLAEYRKGHPELSKEDSETAYFRTLLVDYVNHLAEGIRSKNPQLKTLIHIWPVYVPEPLYGNRLDIDYCGQTAAWYMHWPRKKIETYSKIISGKAKDYHPRQEGVGFIGYYDSPGKFPVKDAERIEMELKAMIENGCATIQVCSTTHVLKNKEVAAVFKRYFKPKKS